VRTSPSFSLFAILLLAVACAPLPTSSPTATLTPNAAPEEIPQASATPASQGAAAGWQTYANTDAGFSIQYPPDWHQTVTSASPPMYGVALDGLQGGVELQWGEGFGGACNAPMALRTAQGQLSTCYWVGDDGTRHWEQIYKMLPTTAFGARGYTKDAAPASTDLVLAVFATLTFGETAVAPTPQPALGMEVIIDNRDAGFRPKGNWYILPLLFHKSAEMVGEDCYQARPGRGASAEVRPDLPAGAYEVYARWCGDPGATNQSTHGVIEVHRSAGDAAPQAVGVNYQAGAGQWQSLGVYNLEPDAFLSVNSVLDGSVVADAYRFVYRSPAAVEAVPTPLPTGPITTHYSPTPLQQATSGDLATRLSLVDPFFVSVPMTATQQIFDDCRAFPREDCGGTRAGWLAIVTHQAISLTYRVSDDYKLVAVEGADLALDPWLMGQDTPQLVFLRGSGGGMNFTVHASQDNTWHLLRPGSGSLPDSDVTLTPDQAAILRSLAPKYSTWTLQPAGGGSLTFYGLGPAVVASAADRDVLLALGSALAAAPP